MESKSIEDITKELAAPFSENDIEWRVMRELNKGTKVVVAPYLTSRAIMDRLDAVVGIDNWCDSFSKWNEKGNMCGLSLRLNGEWITKYDAGEETDIEPVRGGFSGAIKRAAVKWGIGRYLYHLGESTVPLKASGTFFHKVKGDGANKGKYMYWDAPSLSPNNLPGVKPTTDMPKINSSVADDQPIDPLEVHYRDWCQAGTEERLGRIQELQGLIGFVPGDQLRQEALGKMPKERQLSCIFMLQQLTNYKFPAAKAPEKQTVDQRGKSILYLESRASDLLHNPTSMKPEQQAHYVVFLEEMAIGLGKIKAPEPELAI